MTNFELIKHDIFNDLQSNIENLSKISIARDRDIAFRSVGSIANVHWLEEEQLLTMYFSNNISLSINYEDQNIVCNPPEGMSQEQANEIIKNEWNERYQNLMNAFELELSNIKPDQDLDINLEDNNEEVIVENENELETLQTEPEEDTDIDDNVNAKKKSHFRNYKTTDSKQIDITEQHTNDSIFNNSEQNVTYTAELNNTNENHDLTGISNVEVEQYETLKNNNILPNHDADWKNNEIKENTQEISIFSTGAPFNSRTNEAVLNPNKISNTDDIAFSNSGYDRTATESLNDFLANGSSNDERFSETKKESTTNKTDYNVEENNKVSDVKVEGMNAESLRESEKVEAWTYNFKGNNSVFRYFEQAANSVKQDVRQVANQSENNMTVTGATAVLGIINPVGSLSDTYGAKMVESFQKEKQEKLSNVSTTFAELINKKNGISISDLQDTDVTVFKSKLENAGLSASEISDIIKNKNSISSSLETWNDLIAMADKGKINLSESEKALLYSKNFLTSKIDNETYQSILSKALRETGYGFLNEKNIDSFSIKDLKNAIALVEINRMKDAIEKAINDGTMAVCENELKFFKDKFLSSYGEEKRNLLLKFISSNNTNNLFNMNELKKMDTKSLQKHIMEKMHLGDTTTVNILKEKLKRAELKKLRKSSNTKGLLKKISRSFKTLYQLNGEDNFTSLGAKKIKSYYRKIDFGTRLTFKSLKLTGKTAMFATTIPGRFIAMAKGEAWGLKIIHTPEGKKIVRSHYNSIYRKVNKKIYDTKNRFKTTAKSRYQKTTVGRFSSNVKGKFERRKTKIRTKMSSVKKKFAKSKVGKVASFIAKPFQFIGKIFSIIGKVKRIIFLAIGGAALTISILYIILLLLSNVLYNLTEAGTDVYESTILMESQDLQELVGKIQLKEQERYVNALDKALNPIFENGLGSEDVYGGYKIKFYGLHKMEQEKIDAAVGTLVGNTKTYTIKEDKYNYTGNNTSTGYHIYYIDSQGNQIGKSTSNIKDVISMANIMYNNCGMEDPALINEIANSLYNKMNPDINIVESDIYFCNDGCHYFPENNGINGNGTSPQEYKCYDDEVYNEYNRLKESGVTFYGNLADKTSEGCKYKVICDGHTHTDDDGHTHKSHHSTKKGYVKNSVPSGCDNCHTEYYCDGHSAIKCCPGHKDVNIYVTVLSYEDVLNNPNGMITYKIPSVYSEDGASDTYIEKTVDINVRDDAWGDNYNSFVNDGKWECPSYQRMLKKMVEADWYDLYGVAVDNTIAHIQGTLLSSDDISSLMELADDTNASADGLKMTEFALNYVGAISYKLGSKAHGIGDSGLPASMSLDCSGFVSWCYGTTVGHMPSGQGTANFTSSVGATPISYRQLKAGDVGLMALPGHTTKGHNYNHIGIYVGKDENGNDMWVHCNGSTGNVACNNVSYFKYYYRLF